MRLRSVSPGLAVLVLRRSRTSAEHAALLLVSHAANALMSADMCAGAPSQITSHRRRPGFGGKFKFDLLAGCGLQALVALLKS